MSEHVQRLEVLAREAGKDGQCECRSQGTDGKDLDSWRASRVDAVRVVVGVATAVATRCRSLHLGLEEQLEQLLVGITGETARTLKQYRGPSRAVREKQW